MSKFDPPARAYGPNPGRPAAPAPPPPKFAAAYLRRSGGSTTNPGNASEDAQRAAVRSLCGDDVTIYKDWAISGRRNDRPDYVRLKADIVAGRVGSVCAYSLSRLGRSARELLDFIELCRIHDVAVRTTVENIDTSGAMGRAMFTIMAAFSQLEAELGMERTAAARESKRLRYEAAGLEDPGSHPRYGFRNVKGEDGLYRREIDPEHPLRPLLDAYAETRSVLAACKLLQERGIPAPGGGAAWGPSTLTTILDREGVLPSPNPRGLRRPVKKPALFAGLISCHCGRTLTPSGRKQLYCHKGRDEGVAVHGRYTATERKLVAQLKPHAAQYMPDLEIRWADDTSKERERLVAKGDRLAMLFADGRISAAKYHREVGVLDAAISRIASSSRAVAKLMVIPRGVDWNAPVAETNDLLRTLWSRVQLDRDLRVKEVEWRIPERFHDVGVANAYDREMDALLDDHLAAERAHRQLDWAPR